MGYAPPNRNWFKKLSVPGMSMLMRGPLKDRWGAALHDPLWIFLAALILWTLWNL